MAFLLILYLVSGTLLTALSIPLILRRIPPNGLYGFRAPATLSNPDLWYKVNTYAGKRLLAVGLATVVAAAALYAIPGLTVDAYALDCAGVTLGLLAIGLVQSFLYLRSLTPRP